ncbi:MAG: DUF6056 family protein [PVC group bacterium]
MVDICFWLSVGLIVLLFLSLSYYAYPSGDDFCYANCAARRGFWDSQRIWYERWTGRYTYNFVCSLVARAPVFEGGMYCLIPLASFLGIWVALYVFSFRIIPHAPNRLARAGGVTAFMALYLTHLPAPGPLYWLASIINYQIATILFLLLATVMIGKPGRFFGARTTYATLGASVLAALVIGCSETMLLIIFYGLAAGTALSWIRGHPDRRHWLIVLCICAAAAAIVYFSPGNSIRFAMASRSRDPVMVIPALKKAIGLVVAWSSSPGLLLLSILFAPIAQITARAAFSDKGKTPRWMLLIPVLWITGILISFIPSAWGLGKPPFPRTVNLIYFIFLTGWFSSLVILIPYFIDSTVNLGVILTRIRAAAKLLLIIVFALQPNTIDAAGDLIVYGPRFKSALEKRRELIQSSIARGETELRVQPLPVKPRSIFFNELTPNSKHWKNLSFARYHGLTSIVMTEAERP